MMRRWLAGVVGAAAVATVAGTALVHGQGQPAPIAPHEQAGPGPGGPHGPRGFGRGGPFGGPGMGDLALLRRLDLSEDQRAQVQQVMQSHRDEMRAVHERLAAAHRAQHEAVTAPTFDEQAIREKAAEVAAVSADAAVLRAKVHAEVFAVLTPEQQAKAAEIKAEREARTKQLRERRQQRMQQRQQQRQQRAQPPAVE